MNWKLILGLSLWGLLMGLATTYIISAKYEPVCWLVIFLISAHRIAEYAIERYFLHGFFTGLFDSIWMGIVHSAFSADYYTKNVDAAHNFARMVDQWHVSNTVAMLIMSLIIGAASGLVLGLFSYIASKIF